MAITLDRSSTDAAIKDAYDKGLSIAKISELTERAENYVFNLCYVGDDVDAESLETQILGGANDGSDAQATAKTK